MCVGTLNRIMNDEPMRFFYLGSGFIAMVLTQVNQNRFTCFNYLRRRQLSLSLTCLFMPK